MKPRNKFQKNVFEQSRQLPKISKVQKAWMNQYCFEHIARKTKKGAVSCIECGHKWIDKKLSSEYLFCPHCGIKLKVSETRKQIFKQTEYACIITICGGFQVLRFFYLNAYGRVGAPTHYFQSEVVQRWIAPNGKYATLAKLRSMNCFQDSWQFLSKLEIRTDKKQYDMMPTCVYERMKIIPEIKKYGFKGDFYKFTPFELFHALLTENKAETLLKIEQTELLRYFLRSYKNNIHYYWSSIRICIRNGYKIEEASMWCDYIDLLNYFDKDVHNAKYVCPENLKVEHDRYLKKKAEKQKQERLEQQRKKMQEDEKRFQEMKSKFFGINFTDGTINICVLESVKEFLEEGECLHHCVYTNEYYLKPNSLILSARLADKRIETLEISLETLKIVQSRGLQNANTQYHGQILKLVRRNMKLIKQRLRQATFCHELMRYKISKKTSGY